MRSTIICSLVSVFLLGAGASSARACVWDRETDVTEREFKSTYNKDDASSPSEEYRKPAGTEQFVFYGSAGTGMGLLLGACLISYKKTQK